MLSFKGKKSSFFLGWESIVLMMLFFFFLYSAINEKKYNNEVSSLENMNISEGVLSVYPPARGSLLFKVSLETESKLDCCIYFYGWYPGSERYSGKMARLYWEYFENVDIRFGFKVVFLEEEGEVVLGGYNKLKRDYKRWESEESSMSLFYMAFFILFLWFFLLIKR